MDVTFKFRGNGFEAYKRGVEMEILPQIGTRLGIFVNGNSTQNGEIGVEWFPILGIDHEISINDITFRLGYPRECRGPNRKINLANLKSLGWTVKKNKNFKPFIK